MLAKRNSSFADCFFTFLPIFMGVTIAKKMGGSPMLFMIVGAALCYPSLISLMGGVDLGEFLGMPVTTPVVVSNTDDYADVVALVTGKVDLNTQILQVKA